MQKLVTKYGLAAHLAFLAVAPLFLSPIPVLWLSALTAVWVVMEPSRVGGEMLHDARRRVSREIVGDPVFWFSLVLVAYVAVRFANGGVAMSYDAENAVWSITQPVLPILPGSVSGAGLPEFSVAVAILVVLQGCRHALGKSARMAFLLVSSALAGLGAAVMAVRYSLGFPDEVALVACNLSNPRFFGSAMGVYWLAGVVSLLAAYERKWLRVMPLTILSIGGTVAGMFLFAPPMVQAVYAAVGMVVLAYSFLYARKRIPASGEFKFLVTFSLSMVLGGVLALSVLPESLVAARLAPFKTGAFFQEDFLALREALSDVALRVWKAHPWLGTGLGSFPLELRFAATESDWAIVSPGQLAPLNGCFHMLVERGIVGAVFVVSLLGFLLWTFGRRMFRGVTLSFPHPACWIGPAALVAAAAEAAVDVSYTVPGFVLAVAAMLSLSASSFPKEERNG